jgi:hypothetical protein
LVSLSSSPLQEAGGSVGSKRRWGWLGGWFGGRWRPIYREKKAEQIGGRAVGLGLAYWGGVRAVTGREKETLLSGRGLYRVKVEDVVVEERVGGWRDLVRCWKWRWLVFVVLVGVRVREGRSGCCFFYFGFFFKNLSKDWVKK